MKNKYWLMVGLFFLGVDRLGKQLSRIKPDIYSSRLIKLELSKNQGFMFFSSVNQWFLIIISLLILIILTYLLIRKSSKKNIWFKALVLIIIGGLSNLYDRIVFGYVIDWLWTAVYPWAVFNLADLMIIAGVGLIGWEQYKQRVSWTKQGF